MTINIMTVYERKNINSPYDSLVEEYEKDNDMVSIINALEGCFDEILWEQESGASIVSVDDIATSALRLKGETWTSIAQYEEKCATMKKEMFARFSKIARLYKENGFILSLSEEKRYLFVDHTNCMNNLIKRSRGYKKINVKTSNERRNIKSTYDSCVERCKKIKHCDCVIRALEIKQSEASRWEEKCYYVWVIAKQAAEIKRENWYTGIALRSDAARKVLRSDAEGLEKDLQYYFNDIALLYKEKGISLRLVNWEYIYVGQCKGCKKCTIGKNEKRGWKGCEHVPYTHSE